MAVTIEELLQRNKSTSTHHQPLPTIYELRAAGNLPKTMIVTCLDPRCIPEMFFNLQTSEVLVYRNAGGNIRHALRDIVVLDHIVGGLHEIAIIHHTDCGAMSITEEETLRAVKAGLDELLWEEVNKLAPFGAWTEYAISFSLLEMG
ncbi:Carbonic anhydrase [Rhypophila decipiens]